MTTEEAKAVQEVAKLGGKLVDATTGFGGWLAEIVGDSPKNLFGLIAGDWIDHQRQRNLMYLQQKTDRIRADIGAGLPVEPAVSVVVPLLQAAADESREELQDLWAALLVSALQPNASKNVRRAFFNTLKQMEPLDALMLKSIAEWGGGLGRVPHEQWHLLQGQLAFSTTEEAVVVQALSSLQLVSSELAGRTLTAYGREFWRACNPQPEP